LGHEPSPLHTQRLKSQHHENSSSTSTTTALSVSCIRTLRELHPPPPALLPLSCPWALASLFLEVIWLYHPLFSLGFAASLSVRTVGNTLSPRLQKAGTTDFSKRKLFNRPRSISPFSSSSLEAAKSDTHTVTDSFHGYWVYPSSPPFRFRPVARLQLQSTHSAGTLLPLYLTLLSRFLHCRIPRLHSVVVLHCLGGGCQHLGFSCNARNAATVYSGPRSPIVLLLLLVTLGFVQWY